MFKKLTLSEGMCETVEKLPGRGAMMPLDMSYKVVVHFDSRPDGGCRAWSDDVPGLILSSTDVDGMISDVPEALKVILTHMLGSSVTVSPLGDIRQALEENGIVSPSMPVHLREYVAFRQ